MSKIVTEVDIRQIYKWSKQKLIEELRFRLNAEIGRVKQLKQLKQREQKLREALSLIVADSCSLHPSSKFMSETALKALEGKALGQSDD